MIRSPGRLEMLYARSAVVTAARAFGLHAIDLVGQASLCMSLPNAMIADNDHRIECLHPRCAWISAARMCFARNATKDTQWDFLARCGWIHVCLSSRNRQ